MNIEIWHLGLTAVGVIIPVVVMLIMFEKSRRKDLREHLSKKASIVYVDKEIKDCMTNHEKVHAETNKQYVQIQSDLTSIKNHIMSKS